MTKASITTHILDLHFGRPASGVAVSLYSNDANKQISEGVTDGDGRILTWSSEVGLTTGIWRMDFDISAWAEKEKRETFFEHVSLCFRVRAADEHYHVPLLLNQFGYTTYRGS